MGIEEGYVKGLSRGVLRASSGVEGNVEDGIFKVTRRDHGVKGGRWRKDWKKARHAHAYSYPRARHMLPPQLGASTSCAASCHVPSNVSRPTRCPEMKYVASPRVRLRWEKKVRKCTRRSRQMIEWTGKRVN
jgi:hypothetical protein